jgi:ABC-type polysaccharide/polyol phosphate export permease
MFEYDSANIRSPFIHELTEVLRYRDLLRLLVSNSVKTRYKRSSLGILWTLLNPLLSTLVLTIALSQIMRFQVENYPVYLLTGLITWNFFAQTILAAMSNLVWGSGLLKRIYIPKTIFALSVLGNSLVNFGLSLIPLMLIMIIMGQPLSWTILLLPFAVLLLTMFTLGLSLFLSTLAVYFVDLVEIFRVLIQAWFYLTPIIYPIDIVPVWFQPLLMLNPMTWMVSIFRSLIFLGELPPVQVVGIATIISILTLIFGWWIFTRKADEFVYRI